MQEEGGSGGHRQKVQGRGGGETQRTGDAEGDTVGAKPIVGGQWKQGREQP